MRVSSDDALNAAKILWLRDSFGLALAPFMAATFTEIVYLHWYDALAEGGRRFVELVKSWQPDYVFVTVVERQSRSELFAQPPPSVNLAGQSSFSARRGSSMQSVNEVVTGRARGEWMIDGYDPFMDYALSSQIKAQDAPLVAFEVNCGQRSEPIALQVFWLKTGEPYYTEPNSKRLTTAPGSVVLDLTPADGWTAEDEITRIRIDIDAPSTCPVFTISNPQLGDGAMSAEGD